MRPIHYPLAFDEGAVGSADFAVSTDLALSRARLSVFTEGNPTALGLETECVVTAGNVIQVRLTAVQTDELGAGRHSYQLDGLSGADQVRIAQGPLVMAPGRKTTFA
jgi:hypothetical protein